VAAIGVPLLAPSAYALGVYMRLEPVDQSKRGWATTWDMFSPVKKALPTDVER
jgi:hypothetical protein